MTKKVISLFLCLATIVTMFASFQVTVFADEISDHEITLIDGAPSLARSANFNSITASISFPSGTASGSSFLAGSGTDVTKIIAFLYIQKKVSGSWTSIASRQVTINNYYGSASITCTDSSLVEHGYYYRLRVSGYAYKGSSYTADVMYSNEQYY